MIQHATDWESILPPSNDVRRADWAARFYREGRHHADQADAAGHAASPSPRTPSTARPPPGSEAGNPYAYDRAPSPLENEWNAYWAGMRANPPATPL